MIYRIKNTKINYKININPVNLVNPVKKIVSNYYFGINYFDVHLFYQRKVLFSV